MAARVGIVLLVIMVISAQLVALPEARWINHPPVGCLAAKDGRAVAGNGKSAGVRSSKWNMRRSLSAEKRTVPGGPDPQHHY